MSVLFEDLKEGLEQAIAYEKGNGKAVEKTFTITPVEHYTNKEIRDIRMSAGMTQRVFASYMGVSVKTVEAWECGRTNPTGPVFRLLTILKTSDKMDYVIENYDYCGKRDKRVECGDCETTKGHPFGGSCIATS